MVRPAYLVKGKQDGPFLVRDLCLVLDFRDPGMVGVGFASQQR